MALILPLLVLLLFGGLEAGYYLWSEHKVIKSVRDGARFAGRQSFSVVDCDSGTFSDSTVIARIKNLTRTGTIDASEPPVVPGWDDNATQVTVTVECDSDTNTGIWAEEPSGAPIVTVSAEVDYPALFGSIALGINGSKLRASSQAAVMGL